ncbi:MAG: hypothetical protein ABJH68_20945 [Ilumatobacter sp.]|uniref:hypothetical protein n=1 Tax=Ilumatobacter sp. TaxID=1967498 RepID=UPI00329703E4
MRMSTNDAERATAELDVGLRVAGVGRLFGHLASADVSIEPSAWCPGRWNGRGVVVAADIRSVVVLSVVGIEAEPDVRSIDLREISGVSIDASASEFTIDAPTGPIVVTDAPRARVAMLVAYLITHLPHPRHRPGLPLPE